MASLNRVFLIGRLTRDPDLRYLSSGTAVVTFGLATSRVYTAQSGEKKEDTCFVRIVSWGRQAEICNQYLKKGRLVFVEGRLQYRAWETPDGKKRSTLEVNANRVQFLERPAGQEVAGEPLKEMAGASYSGQNSQPAVDLGTEEPPKLDKKFEDEVPF
ncbi:MAG: single-stranded DNA-binding protein [Candidatus Omnitrophota bacterium]|nr:single-stranded DNA-binding protein [Candidatus Omnitrophota bacterium]